MSDPIRIRARCVDGLTQVHILMPHPMETGWRQDALGQPVPAHHITDVQVLAAGRTVLAATLGFAVSQDPLLSFRFRGARSGERLQVSWTDNRGERRTDDVLIT